LVALPAPLVNDDRLSRALDRRLGHQEALQQHLVAHFGELFQLDYDLLLCDVTSVYFEGGGRGEPARSARPQSRSPRGLQTGVGEVSEGAVEAPSDEDGADVPLRVSR
jgi:hypothetical protein